MKYLIVSLVGLAVVILVGWILAKIEQKWPD
jgi:hypothetical protein